MNFSRPFAGGGFPGVAAVAVCFAAAGVVLALNLVVALSVLPAEESREREIPLELVAVSEGTVPLRLSAQEVVVHVGAEGAVRVGGTDVDLETLKARLDALSAGGGLTALAVRADARAPHGIVARILAMARKAGVRDVSVVTLESPPDAPR